MNFIERKKNTERKYSCKSPLVSFPNNPGFMDFLWKPFHHLPEKTITNNNEFVETSTKFEIMPVSVWKFCVINYIKTIIYNKYCKQKQQVTQLEMNTGFTE